MKFYEVKRRLHLKAPQGSCVHVSKLTYTSLTKPTLIETVWQEARNPTYKNPDPAKRIGMSAYFPTAYRRLSMDNGRIWRAVGEEFTQDGNHLEGKRRFPPGQWFDPKTGLLLGLFITYETFVNGSRTEIYNDAGIWSETYRIRYEISRDGGLTWEPSRPFVHKGKEYDETHWGPGLTFLKSHGVVSLEWTPVPPVQLADGAMLAPMEVDLQDGNRYQVGIAHIRWTADQREVEWELSDYIKISLKKSSQGLCEASIAQLDEGRLLVTMRACGDRENHTFPSLKFYSISNDGGWTFTEPKPITYEDDTMVWTPSSFHSLFRSSKNGKLYFLANILDAPTYNSEPRWPLCIAEVDEEKLCLIRETLGVIQGLPDDLSPQLRDAARKRIKGVRYSNWSQYEDRDTKELVLLMATQPNISWDDFTADNYEYRITIPET